MPGETQCHKVFAFPTLTKAREMLKYARPDATGRLFNDAYRCRIPGCNKYHLTTKQGPPTRERRKER